LKMGGGYYGEREVYSTTPNSGPYSTQAQEVMKQTSLHPDCDPKKVTKLVCDAKTPIVISIDVTGSMGDWSKIIYDKLPMFYGQLIMKNYCEDPSLSFAAVGDLNCDEAPIQVTPFSQGAAIDSVLAKIWLEGGGGGQNYESYEMAAYFYGTRCEFTVASKGYAFFTGDEGFYPAIIKQDLEKFLGEKAKAPISTETAFQGLQKFFTVFYLHKPYYDPEIDKNLTAKWKKLIGEENVLHLQDPKSVVDIMLGAISISSGSRNLQTYIQDMRERGQTEDRIHEVSNALDLLNMKKTQGEEKSKSTQTLKNVPDQFLCPITKEIMEDPVTLEGDGLTYDRTAIEEWLSSRDISPITNQILESKELTPNPKLKAAIEKFKKVASK